MMRRLFRSRWWWPAVCGVGGAAAVTISDWLVLRQGLALADAFASGLGARADAPRHYAVSILFGLIPIENTSHPYLWFAAGSLLTGGSLGLAVWCLGQAGLWGWRRRTGHEA